MGQYHASLPDSLSCWPVKEQVLAILNQLWASSAERCVQNYLSVQILAGIDFIQLNKPSKYLDTPWHP
jgi:hypothetical protein